MKRAENQIQGLVTSKAASNYNNDESVRVLRNNRVRTGVLPNRKRQGGNMPKHHRDQHYCIL